MDFFKGFQLGDLNEAAQKHLDRKAEAAQEAERAKGMIELPDDLRLIGSLSGTDFILEDDIPLPDIAGIMDLEPEDLLGEEKMRNNSGPGFTHDGEPLLRDIPKVPVIPGGSFETTPRETLIRLLQSCAIGEKYTFRTAPNRAEGHIGAMRNVLSRARGKAAGKKRLEMWKLIVDTIVRKGTHDEVTLMRVPRGSSKKSVYDKIEGLI